MTSRFLEFEGLSGWYQCYNIRHTAEKHQCVVFGGVGCGVCKEGSLVWDMESLRHL